MTMIATWMDIRDDTGKLLFRYDPEKHLVQIGRRKQKLIFQLPQHCAQEGSKEYPVDIDKET